MVRGRYGVTRLAYRSSVSLRVPSTSKQSALIRDKSSAIAAILPREFRHPSWSQAGSRLYLWNLPIWLCYTLRVPGQPKIVGQFIRCINYLALQINLVGVRVTIT